MNKNVLYILFVGFCMFCACSSDDEPEHGNNQVTDPQPTAIRSLTVIDDSSIEYGEADFNLPLTQDETKAGASMQDFAFRFTQELIAERDNAENTILSPLSAGILLSALTGGTAGHSQEELCSLLGIQPTDLEQTNAYIKKTANRLARLDKSVRLNSANSVWMHYELPVYSSFIEKNKLFYDSDVFGIDFHDKLAGATINGWCSDKTDGLIDHIVDDGPMNGSMLMANALYFKGSWTNGFREEETADGVFHASAGKNQTVPMMHQKFGLPLATAETFDVVSLSFGNEDGTQPYYMNIALPHENMSPDKIIETLEYSTWEKVVTSAQPRLVDLTMPRFSVYNELDLREKLYDMGVHDIFSIKQADFSNLSPEKLFVSLIKQNAHINIDEKGAEAAAVTFVMNLISNGEEPAYIPFHVDRPFFFTIEERTTGTILFMGIVNSL
ncbi:MAG: serpin family protein [Bacteroidaceae bacterium]|nr:serpin family protein [Bacteroidaceae bacterium]